MSTLRVSSCRHCGRDVPIVRMNEDAFDCVLRSLKNGSPSLAAAELVSLGGARPDEAELFVGHLRRCVFSWPFSASARTVLDSIDTAFGPVEKPEHLTDFEHCDECRQHDRKLRSKTRTTIVREDLGNFGWDPIAFATTQGVAYFMPALARFAMQPNIYRDGDWFGGMLCNHLGSDNRAPRLLMAFTHEQRCAIVSLLRWMADHRNQELRDGTLGLDFPALFAAWATPDA